MLEAQKEHNEQHRNAHHVRNQTERPPEPPGAEPKGYGAEEEGEAQQDCRQDVTARPAACDGGRRRGSGLGRGLRRVRGCMTMSDRRWRLGRVEHCEDDEALGSAVAGVTGRKGEFRLGVFRGRVEHGIVGRRHDL